MFVRFIGGLVLACLVSAPALAQQSATKLVGVWELTEYTGYSWKGPRELKEGPTFVMEVEAHDDIIFTATTRWEIGGDGGNVAGTATNSAEESVMGVLDVDNETFVIVEYPDTGVKRMRLIDDDTIEVVSYEPGEFAIVARFTLKRR